MDYIEPHSFFTQIIAYFMCSSACYFIIHISCSSFCNAYESILFLYHCTRLLYHYIINNKMHFLRLLLINSSFKPLQHPCKMGIIVQI